MANCDKTFSDFGGGKKTFSDFGRKKTFYDFGEKKKRFTIFEKKRRFTILKGKQTLYDFAGEKRITILEKKKNALQLWKWKRFSRTTLKRFLAVSIMTKDTPELYLRKRLPQSLFALMPFLLVLALGLPEFIFIEIFKCIQLVTSAHFPRRNSMSSIAISPRQPLPRSPSITIYIKDNKI